MDKPEDHVSHASSRPVHSGSHPSVVSTWSGVTPMPNGGAPLTAKTQSTLTHLLQQQNGNINLVSFSLALHGAYYTITFIKTRQLTVLFFSRYFKHIRMNKWVIVLFFYQSECWELNFLSGIANLWGPILNNSFKHTLIVLIDVHLLWVYMKEMKI